MRKRHQVRASSSLAVQLLIYPLFFMQHGIHTSPLDLRACHSTWHRQTLGGYLCWGKWGKTYGMRGPHGTPEGLMAVHIPSASPPLTNIKQNLGNMSSRYTFRQQQYLWTTTMYNASGLLPPTPTPLPLSPDICWPQHPSPPPTITMPK